MKEIVKAAIDAGVNVVDWHISPTNRVQITVTNSDGSHSHIGTACPYTLCSWVCRQIKKARQGN